MQNLIIYHEGFDKVVMDSSSREIWKPRGYIETIVEQNWKQFSDNPFVWDGPLVRLESSYQNGGALHLTTSSTSYKYHCGTKHMHSAEDRANPIYVCASITTADEKLVLGLRNNTAKENGLYSIAGGGVDPELDSPDSVPSLDSALFREIYEEFGIFPSSCN